MKRDISIEDIKKGNAVQFYKEGFRTDIVTHIQKRRKSKCYLIHTSRYGKIPFEMISDVFIYDGKTTTRKPIMGDLFE